MQKILTIFCILFCGLPCFAVTFNGFVADEAHILTSQKIKEINILAQDLQNRTGVDVAVITLNKKDLHNKQLSDVTLNIGREHKIGSKYKNEGVLFALVPQGNMGNRVRIEVGYGLEQVLNDGKCGRILDNYVMSYYEKGQYEKAVEQGFIAIINELNEYYENPEQYNLENQEKTELSLAEKVIIVLFILMLIVCIIISFDDDNYYGGGSGGFRGFSGGSNLGSFGGFGGGGCGR